MRSALFVVAAVAALHGRLAAQPAMPANPADATLERLVGAWRLTGTVRGKAVTYRGEGRRTLQGRFVELHLEDAAVPPAYEARIAIGADTVPGRVLAHWLDSYGGAFSVPHGTGAVRADTLQFTLAYRDGPFRDTFVFESDGSWSLHIESRAPRGGWQTFARYTAVRAAAYGAAVPAVPGEPRRVASFDVIDLAPGTGAAAAPGQCYAVHYTGWLTDGTRFSTTRDSTADGRPRPPLVFPQGFRRVIAGWDAGFEGLRVGGRRRLIIPYQFGYGEIGRPPTIPPRATLIFDVELMGVADTLRERDGDKRFPACAPFADTSPPRMPPTTWREITAPGIVGRVLRFADWPAAGLKARHVDVWLPPGYEADRAARFPVIYLHDGQNVFDPATSYGGQEWGFDDVVAAMTTQGRLPPAILVGLWNTADRWREYLPQQAVADQQVVTTGIGGRADASGPWLADAYLRFLVDEVKPHIDRSFRTRPDRASTFVMGSSMGGLASLYALAQYPQVFGGAAAISTHWPAADGRTLPWLASHLPAAGTRRIWMDHGTATLDSLYPPLQARMDTLMRRAGWVTGESWQSRSYPGAAHDERSWRARLHEPLAFLLGTRLPAPSAEDSALIGRLLLAEDRRDAADPAMAAGLAHPDERVRRLARRARGRVADPLFVARDSIGADAAAPWWPEPAWRARYRALKAPGGQCAPLRAALGDSSWIVRLRALDLVDASCTGDDALQAVIRGLADALPADASTRAAGGVSWHAAAHALVALARAWPDSAPTRLRALARHRQWQVRAYAARAADVLGDTATLRQLARDRDDNVAEVAIERLARRTGHADDALYLQAITRNGAQVVRAAATALAGSNDPRTAAAATTAFERWVARDNASARDARLALLAAAGRAASDDRPPPTTTALPPRAVALALGLDLRLRVTMAPSAGGGQFTVKLRGDVAPMMAARILALVERGYYDGLTWHRVEPDFVIQGGSPGANEYVGLASFLRDELGTVAHPRGTVGMSTRGHDTGDAQWFVNLRDNPRLRRDYTIFGEVTDGISVVDGVLEGDVIASIRVVPPGTP